MRTTLGLLCAFAALALMTPPPVAAANDLSPCLTYLDALADRQTELVVPAYAACSAVVIEDGQVPPCLKAFNHLPPPTDARGYVQPIFSQGYTGAAEYLEDAGGWLFEGLCPY